MLAHTGSKNEEEMAEHLGRVKSAEVVNVITVTLAAISEIQGILKFPGKNDELRYLWTVLGLHWETPKELYERRYELLLN